MSPRDQMMRNNTGFTGGYPLNTGRTGTTPMSTQGGGFSSAPTVQLPNLPQPSNLQPTGMQYNSATGNYTAQYAPPPPSPDQHVGGVFHGPDNNYSSGGQGYDLNPLEQEEYMLRLKTSLATNSRKNALDQFKTAMGGINGPGADPGTEAFEAAQYARAKDTIGRQKLSALNSFRDVMNGKGLYGSSREADGVGEILSGASGDLADVVMNQVGSNITRGRQVADRNFAADNDYRRALLSALSSAFASSGSLY
jgi:hypothetical protein